MFTGVGAAECSRPTAMWGALPSACYGRHQERVDRETWGAVTRKGHRATDAAPGYTRTRPIAVHLRNKIRRAEIHG